MIDAAVVAVAVAALEAAEAAVREARSVLLAVASSATSVAPEDSDDFAPLEMVRRELEEEPAHGAPLVEELPWRSFPRAASKR